MKTTRTIYVCSNNCGIAYHHPLKFCPNCPGKLIQKELPWDYVNYPKGYFEKDGIKKYEEWVNGNNLVLPYQKKNE